MTEFLDRLRVANAQRNTFLDPERVLTPLFFAVELGGEAGEALNCVKKLHRQELMDFGQLRGAFSLSSVEKLAEELADIIICCDLLAEKYKIDLISAVVKKWNATSKKIGAPHRLEYTT